MKNLIIFILMFLISINGYAQTDKTDKKTMLMDTLVIKAEKSMEDPQTGDVDIEASPVNISIIKREDFEGKSDSLIGIIEKETGVQVRQSGGLGSFSSISLRGSASDQIMVFIDGILLNDASGGGVDLSNIALSDVESIEIYRGITPVNFSKASIGGVVNIKTLRPKKGLNTSINAGWGSFNTQKLSGFINHKLEKWDYLVSADYLSSDNDYDILNNNGTQWNTLDDKWEKRQNAEVSQGNILGKAGYNFNDNIRIDIANQYFTKDQELPGWDNSSLTDSSLETTRNISTLKLNLKDLSSLNFDTSTQISYTWKQEEYDDRGGI
ncbi:TonB-dependent receptor plug domain-containing protein [Desulfonema limicola]|uniref:TonB-dependent receptor plug domain-containing protein n=1 Tax=Desulfonema limicola TaxID=45656 RepID=A0A975BC32_9BACT|nr:TonB-dependent receptor plug domain-containing protein [Desulfonema limicola]QTA82613.1 TonB-dependent receptor plug domain-containing protein [Desulfonema limicola]